MYFRAGDFKKLFIKSKLLFTPSPVLRGPEVLPSHCLFENLGGEVTLCPCEGALCLVNGVEVNCPTRLSQGEENLEVKADLGVKVGDTGWVEEETESVGYQG